MLLQLLVSRRPVAAALALSAWASTARLCASIALHQARAPPEIDPTVIYPITLPKLLVNNLGGLGPETQKAKELRFLYEFMYQGKQMQIDTIMEAMTPYEGNVERNEVVDNHMQINVAPGTDVTLKVSFQDHQTGTPFTMTRCSLAILDLDTGRDKNNELGGFEAVLAGPLLSYSVTNSTQVRISNAPNSSDYFVFNSSTRGRIDDNPVEGVPLTQEQQDRSVVMEFASTSKFRLQLSASPARGGRTFILGGVWGQSQADYHTTYVGPCSDHHHLDLSFSKILNTDLTGGGFRFTNVFPYYSQSVDLVITADRDYVPWNAESNGLNGACGIINLAAGRETNLTFTFVDSALDSAVRMENFFFSALDVDKTRAGVERVTIDSHAWSKRWVSFNSSLRESVEDDFIIFDAGSFGEGSDNPTDPMKLNREQMAASVTLFRKEPMHQFHMKLTATEDTWTGRNFLFAGRTNYACPNLA